MQIFRNRPLALSCCLYALIALAAWQMDGMIKHVLLILSFAALFGILSWALVRRRFGKRMLFSLLCIGAIALSLLSSFCFFNVRYASLQERIGEECRIEATVLERLGSAPYYSWLRVRVTSLDGEEMNFDALFECDTFATYQVGERFSATVIPRDYTEDEKFDEQTYRLSEGGLLILTCEDISESVLLPERDNGLLISLRKLNTRLSYRISTAIGGEAGGMTAALLLGNTRFLSADTSLAFRRTGTSHILSLSGMHIAVLIAFLELVLRRFPIIKQVRVVIVSLAAIAYLALTGFIPSLCRSVLMVLILYLAFFSAELYDAFTSLCASLVIILALTPYAVVDLSMWMSFLATAGIVIFSPFVADALEDWKRRKQVPLPLYRIVQVLVSAVAVGVSANLALLLLSACVFGEFSLLSIPATLLLTIPTNLLMILGAILLFLPFLPILPQICAWIANMTIMLTDRCADLRGVLFPVGDLPTQIVLVLLTLSLILLAVLKLRRKRWLFTPLLLAALAVCTSLCVTYLPRGEELSCRVFETYRGELHLYTRNGEAVLVNLAGGNISEAIPIKNAALDARCTEIGDLVFGRYYNQATYFILKLAGRVRIETIHLPTPTDEREEAIAARLTQEAEKHGIRVEYDAERWLVAYP